MRNIIVMSLFPFLLSGCLELRATVDKEKSPAVSYCVDTRDGERFSFKSENVINARIGINDVCFDVTDNNGNERTLCKSHEPYIKCGSLPQKL